MIHSRQVFRSRVARFGVHVRMEQAKVFQQLLGENRFVAALAYDEVTHGTPPRPQAPASSSG